MNNSFPRLSDGVCQTLRTEVLSRVDDEYARSQIYGVINLLNTFKLRADWSAGLLLQQIDAQQQALRSAALLAEGVATAPVAAVTPLPVATPIAELLDLRDECNRHIGRWLDWLHAGAGTLAAEPRQAIEAALLQAMRAEVELELRHSPRPLFAEMSGAAEV